MRVLMASDLFYPLLFGGGERQMYEIARRLVKKHEIHVLMRRLKRMPPHEVHKSIHIHRVYTPSKGIALESPIDGGFFVAGSLFKSLRLREFDVYVPQQFFPLLSLWLASGAGRKPVVAIIHDVYREMWIRRNGVRGTLMAAFESVLLRLPYTRVITVSESTKQKLIANGIPEERIKVVYNGVDVGPFDAVNVKKSSKPRVIYTGRLVGYKNLDVLIKAFSKLKSDADLYIVGEGPEKENLERLAHGLGVGDRVFFTGFINEEEKIKLVKSSHVLVLPSSTEGFGISAIEAMAAKTPVIVSSIPALRELVKGEKTGVLFELNNVDDLKNKLEMLLMDRSLQTKLSRRGYNLVKRKFNWDKTSNMVEKVLLDAGGSS